MDCPKCGGPLQPGWAVVERSPGDWATVGLSLLADVVPVGSSLYFEPSEGGERGAAGLPSISSGFLL
jgi:hypothetical protein